MIYNRLIFSHNMVDKIVILFIIYDKLCMNSTRNGLFGFIMLLRAAKVLFKEVWVGGTFFWKMAVTSNQLSSTLFAGNPLQVQRPALPSASRLITFLLLFLKQLLTTTTTYSCFLIVVGAGWWSVEGRRLRRM